MENKPYEPREIEAAVYRWGKMLFRICFSILGNKADAEDAVQETFVKYMTKAPFFDSEAFEKAWLIRVATNAAKGMAFFRLRHNHADIDALKSLVSDESSREIILEVMALPLKYKIVMDLFYIEGYSVREISQILAVPETALRKRLQHGRKLLKECYIEGSSDNGEKQLC